VIDNVFECIGVADTHGDVFRNIVSIRVSQDLFDDLSDDPKAWASAINLELATKPPEFKSPIPIIDRPFEEAAWNEAIGYPFTHWMRSRYSDGSFGVWYGSASLEISVHETAHHWRAGLLADAGFLRPGIKIERKIYQVRCDAMLIDLRPAVSIFPALVDPTNFSLTHQMGARMHREGQPGLVTKSARCEGDVYAMFNAKVLSAPRHTGYLSYTTTAHGVDVERQLGTIWMSFP
jgi:hypothetical protein